MIEEKTLECGVILKWDVDWREIRDILDKAKSMAEMKEMDRAAIEDAGVDSLWLMENAAIAVCDEVTNTLRNINGTSVIILCGTGNNGGDGLACGRILLDRGMQVHTYICGSPDKLTKDAAEMLTRLKAVGGIITFIDSDGNNLEKSGFKESLEKCDLVIDALFGVGIAREITGVRADLIRMVNDSPEKKVVACDIPSGINGDTGEVMGVAMKASSTITFSEIKKGMLLGEAPAYMGILQVVPIGLN